MNKVNKQNKSSGYEGLTLCIWYTSYDGMHIMSTEKNVYVIKSAQCGIFFLHLQLGSSDSGENYMAWFRGQKTLVSTKKICP